MSGKLDDSTDLALAGLFFLPLDAGPTDTIEVLWGDVLAAQPPATQTLRLEGDAQEQPLPPVRSKRLGKHGEEDLDYEIGALLAKGGGGRIFEGKQASTGRLVALKRLSPEWTFDPAMRTRFLREGMLAAGFTHPHLLGVIDLGVDQDDVPFIVMPRVEGVPWSRSIGERSRKANLAILAKVAEAVFCLHSHGVIHRDIKPANVLLGPGGEVWLTDWGLAARLPDPGRGRGLPGDAASGGTPAYMSPEMARDERTLVGFSSDVFLLGAVLWEILNGQPPHAADSAAESLQRAARSLHPRPPIRGGLPALVSMALKTEPGERPTLPEFVATLRHVSQTSLYTRLFASLAGALVLLALFLGYSFLPDSLPGWKTDPQATALQETRAKSEQEAEEIRKRIEAIVPHSGSRAHFFVDEENGLLAGFIISDVRLETLDFLKGHETLKHVAVRNAGLVSLEPLEGLLLTDLDVMDNNITSLSPLGQMPLRYLNIAKNPVLSLEPVRNAPLTTLLVGGTKIDDLSPLRGMPLMEVDLGGRDLPGNPAIQHYGLRIPAHDLEPLRGAPLRFFRCEGFSAKPESSARGKPITSLAFLQGNTTLQALSVAGNALDDLSPLAGLPLVYVDIADNKVEDLSPLAMPSIDFISCDNNRITTLWPLVGQRLGILLCDGNPVLDYAPYRSFSRLRAAWSKREAGLPENMPEEIRSEVQRSLLPSADPPLIPDAMKEASQYSYYSLYEKKRRK